MAAYAFETMSASDAASFTADDYLIFITDNSTANQVTVEPYGNGSSGSSTGSGINLTFGGKTLTFPNDIAFASHMTNEDGTSTSTGHILFQDDSHLQIGTQAGATLAPGANSLATADGTFTPVGNEGDAGTFVDPQTVYALGGNDVLDFSTEAAARSDYLNGGFGADTIIGGDANSHIWGNSMSTQPGQMDSSGTVDGADSITVGSGSNYINGNAGSDNITVGTAAGTGDDTIQASNGTNHVLGGADADTITILGDGHNSVNGNTGNDTIMDMGGGDNTLRGGLGNDEITGGTGHSVLMGDVGNDTIIISGSTGNETEGSGVNHIDLVTGGSGSDLFDFTAAGAATAASFGQVTYYQEITDFQQGTDHLAITTGNTSADVPSGVEAGEVGHSSTVFTSVHDAELYAQSQLSQTDQSGNNSFTVSSLAVGSANNTYLFYNDAAATDPSTNGIDGIGIIHLDNVTASTISYTDFGNSATAGA